MISQESIDVWKEVFRVVPLNETYNELKKYDIDLYNKDGEFKTMLTLLEELSEKWNDAK